MNFKKFKLIYISTLQKEIRSKTLLFLLLFTLLVLIISGVGYHYITTEVLTDMSSAIVGDGAIRTFLGFFGGWTGMLAIFFGVGCIRSDLESNVISQLLSFPIRRFEYLLARIFGTFTMVVGYYLISLVASVIIFGITSGKMALGWNTILSYFVSMPAYFGLVLISVFFSMFLPKLMSFFSVMFIYFVISVSNLSLGTKGFEEAFTNMSFFKGIGTFFHWGFPRVSVWNEIASHVLIGKDIPYNMGMEVSHYVIIVLLWIVVLSAIFRKRDL